MSFLHPVSVLSSSASISPSLTAAALYSTILPGIITFNNFQNFASTPFYFKIFSTTAAVQILPQSLIFIMNADLSTSNTEVGNERNPRDNRGSLRFLLNPEEPLAEDRPDSINNFVPDNTISVNPDSNNPSSNSSPPPPPPPSGKEKHEEIEVVEGEEEEEESPSASPHTETRTNSANRSQTKAGKGRPRLYQSKKLLDIISGGDDPATGGEGSSNPHALYCDAEDNGNDEDDGSLETSQEQVVKQRHLVNPFSELFTSDSAVAFRREVLSMTQGWADADKKAARKLVYVWREFSPTSDTFHCSLVAPRGETRCTVVSYIYWSVSFFFFSFFFIFFSSQQQKH
jgi:hypothetical protein